VRVENWRAKGVFDEVAQAALRGANIVMDEHTADAKRRCPKGTITRQDGSVNRAVVFTPKTGKGKGKEVRFAAKTWTGREPGSLKATIRKVIKHDRPGNLRCYAGNNKIFYARFVEYGTASTGWGGPAKAQPFMRPSFHAIKGTARERIEEEMRKVPEVK
jgi:HK97 gp10 family phage protein